MAYLGSPPLTDIDLPSLEYLALHVCMSINIRVGTSHLEADLHTV